VLLLGLRRRNSAGVGNRGDQHPTPGYALARQSVRDTGEAVRAHTGPPPPPAVRGAFAQHHAGRVSAVSCLELSFPIDTRRTAQRASRFTTIQAQQHAAQMKSARLFLHSLLLLALVAGTKCPSQGGVDPAVVVRASQCAVNHSGTGAGAGGSSVTDVSLLGGPMIAGGSLLQRRRGTVISVDMDTEFSLSQHASYLIYLPAASQGSRTTG
jgi:hypothetical protein